MFQTRDAATRVSNTRARVKTGSADSGARLGLLLLLLLVVVGGSSFTESELATLEKSSEKFQFQAEVNRLMDIIINSLYKTKVRPGPDPRPFVHPFALPADDVAGKPSSEKIDGSLIVGRLLGDVRLLACRKSSCVS